MDPAARTIVKLICLAFSVMQWGCAHVISPELRAAAKKDLDLPKVMADPERYLGEVVIWGGMILEAEPEEEVSTLVVLESPLDVEGTPRDPEFTRGRFLARSKAFLDPAVYCRGRKVTIAGVFSGMEQRSIGQLSYPHPVLSVRELHLWRETVGVWLPRYPWYWGDPYWPWGPWWPGWGIYWRAY